MGYQKDQILIIDDVYAAGEKVNSFKEEVKQLGLVQNASLSSYLPTPSNRSDWGFQLEGAEQAEETVQLQYWRVDHEYVNTLGIEMISGRAFDRSFATDSSSMVLNESAVKLLNMTPEEIIGKRLSNFGDNALSYTVIGVSKNFHYDTFKDEIGALSLVLGSFSNKLIVKLLPGEFTHTISSIEEKWETVAAGQPFNYYFLDDSFNDTYQSEKKLGSIFMVFTILSILVASLGLFGLAAFNADKRRKEIGVRKVMGASVAQITYRLTVDFLKLVGVAILIALPLGYFVMNKWLEDFSYRIDVAWWVLMLAALLAIFISILTVSYQSIKAAIANPIISLKSE